jgi:hypothetical protein
LFEKVIAVAEMDAFVVFIGQRQETLHCLREKSASWMAQPLMLIHATFFILTP